MTRYRLGYAPPYSADSDAGGAADLQTDIMRFMAILSLCLVAIFALVQSIPMTPAPPTNALQETPPEPTQQPSQESKQEPTVSVASPVSQHRRPQADAHTELRHSIAPPAAASSTPRTVAKTATPETVVRETAPPPAVVPDTAIFTLRFASNAALTRLVAQQKVGLYAIGEQRALRLAISESKASFWDASMPNQYHQMDANTVPRPVIDALARADKPIAGVRWGVTLPNPLKTKLDRLMQSKSGGSLVITRQGDITLETP